MFQRETIDKWVTYVVFGSKKVPNTPYNGVLFSTCDLFISGSDRV